MGTLQANSAKKTNQGDKNNTNISSGFVSNVRESLVNAKLERVEMVGLPWNDGNKANWEHFVCSEFVWEYKLRVYPACVKNCLPSFLNLNNHRRHSEDFGLLFSLFRRGMEENRNSWHTFYGNLHKPILKDANKTITAVRKRNGSSLSKCSLYIKLFLQIGCKKSWSRGVALFVPYLCVQFSRQPSLSRYSLHETSKYSI